MPWIGEQIQAARQPQSRPIPIDAGLFLAALDREAFVTALDSAAATGAAGVSLFELRGVSDQHFEALRRMSLERS